MFTSKSSLAFLILLIKQIQSRPLETEGVAELQASEAWETQEGEKREVSPAVAPPTNFHSTLLPCLVSSKYFRNMSKMQCNPEKRTTQWPLKVTISR